jgi:hypothetical protein
MGEEIFGSDQDSFHVVGVESVHEFIKLELLLYRFQSFEFASFVVPLI